MNAAFKSFCERHLEPNEPIVVGISGGPDSVALTHALLLQGLRPILAHVNYGLRGKESDQDEAFCRSLAAQYKLQIEVLRVSKADYSESNTQIWARETRYAFFEMLRTAHGCRFIAVGHHRDDQVETFFINLMRSSGIAGLRGMASIGKTIVRPLLHVSRDEILAYLHQHGLAHREDKSNAQQAYVRNAIRHSVIPALEEINTNAKTTVVTTMEHLSEVELVLRQELAKHLSSPDWCGIRQINLQNLPFNNPGLVLFLLCQPYGFNRNQIEDLLKAKQPGKTITSTTHEIANAANNWHLVEKELQIIEGEIDEVPQNILCGWDVECTADLHMAAISKNPLIAQLDRDQVTLPIRIRNWQEGDRFQPLGLNYKVKVSDYFTDKKISVLHRRRIPIFESKGKIIWVGGVQIADHVKITSSTKSSLTIQLK